MSYQEDKLTEIADAIRSKEGSSDPIVASEFAERIEALSTGGTAGVRSFNGRTGAVVPGVNDYTAEMVGALSEDGGTLYGDLRIKPSGTYGGHLNFGDGDYVEISEPEDDVLQIKASKIHFVASDATDDKFTLNGQPIGAQSGDVVSSFNGRTGDVYPEAGDYPIDFIGGVPTARTINGKPLTTNITLTANDVDAVPSSRTINGKPLTENISLTASDLGISESSVQMSDVQNLLNRTTAVNVANTSYSTIMARGIYAGTADMTAGSSPLTSGAIYLQYE